MAASTGTNRTGAETVPETLALVFGAVYLLVGIIGFFCDRLRQLRRQLAHDMILGLFMVNPLHNIAHILVGVLGLALGRTLAGARTYGWLLAVLYAALFVYGLIAVGKSWDFLNINGADNVLHILTAAVGLVIALLPVRTAVGRSQTV